MDVSNYTFSKLIQIQIEDAESENDISEHIKQIPKRERYESYDYVESSCADLIVDAIL